MVFFVVVAALPQISLRPMEDTITVIAGETTTIDCMVSNARPVPAIMWMLGKMKDHLNFIHNIFFVVWKLLKSFGMKHIFINYFIAVRF